MAFTKSPLPRIRIKFDPIIPRPTVAFRAVCCMDDPLPRGYAPAVARELDLDIRTMVRVLELKRLFDKNPSLAPIKARVVTAEMSVHAALSYARIATGYKPRKKREHRRIYHSVYLVPSPTPPEKVKALAKSLGVDAKRIREAIQLKELLLSNRALFDRWQGIALTKALTPRVILRRIAREHANALIVVAPAPADAKPPSDPIT